MRYLILFPLILLFGKTYSQDSKIKKKKKWHWNNNKAKQDTVAGYTQVLKVDNILYISGAVATEITPEGITSVYNDLKASLSSFELPLRMLLKRICIPRILIR